MADEFNQEERTEQATPRKREKVREQGQVARSQELNSVVVIFFGLVALAAFGSAIRDNIFESFVYNIRQCRVDLTLDTTYQLFLANGALLVKMIAPVIVFVAVASLLVNFAQVGAVVSFKPLAPRLDKLNLVQGAKRLFSGRLLVDLLKDSLKILIVGSVAYLTLRSEIDNYVPLVDQGVGQIMAFTARIALKIGLRIAGALLVLAILDYAYQRFSFERQIRMTRQELKEEYKLYEGDPLIKSRIRRIQRELARTRMLSEVPKADVVVTNPAHVAVALRYDPDTMSAPTVVAKGQRLLAEKIKQIAIAAGVPIVENKPLAWALFEAVEVGMMIPAKLYRAVAEVLAYVYRLKGKV